MVFMNVNEQTEQYLSGFVIAQTVEWCAASNTTVMGLIPKECMNWSNLLWTH